MFSEVENLMTSHNSTDMQCARINYNQLLYFAVIYKETSQMFYFEK